MEIFSLEVDVISSGTLFKAEEVEDAELILADEPDFEDMV